MTEYQHLPECPAYGVEKWAKVDECGPCDFLMSDPYDKVAP